MRMRIRLSDTEFQAKVWQEASGEPGPWTTSKPVSPTMQTQHLTIVANRSGSALPGVEVDSIQFVTGLQGGGGGTGWGTGNLGTWLPISQMTDSSGPEDDDAAWTDGAFGRLTYTGRNDPTQGLRIAQPAPGEHLDPIGLPPTEYWPLEVEFLATWLPGAQEGYIQFYMVPAFHYELNAWDTVTIQWYGLTSRTSSYGLDERWAARAGRSGRTRRTPCSGACGSTASSRPTWRSPSRSVSESRSTSTTPDRSQRRG